MENNEIETSKENLPQWTRFPLKELPGSLKYSASVLMGHYLIVIVNDDSEKEIKSRSGGGSLFGGGLFAKKEGPFLLAVDLRDFSIQEASIKDLSLYKDYSFTKYNENQIVTFGGLRKEYETGAVHLITITSFQPFSFQVEKLADDTSKPAFSHHTAQINKDCLYTYGRYGNNYQLDPLKSFWCFNLKTKSWKQVETIGDSPDQRYGLSSVCIQNFLYIYGGKTIGGGHDEPFIKDIFVFNFDNMTWTKLQQPENYLGGVKLGGDLYKQHLLFLGTNDEYHYSKETDVLNCWNIETSNAFSTFSIAGMRFDREPSNLIVYKNLLLICGRFYPEEAISLAILNLENIDLLIKETSEERRLRSLFMSQEGSDITFQVENKTIPAHKEILIKKSQYFANLFNSGMVESRQQILEIEDCEYDLFKEFLRFIYCPETKFDIDLAMKLFPLADKYVQNDLSQKCIDSLIVNINSDHVYQILEFAREKNIPQVLNWCMKYLRKNINEITVPGLITYLETPTKPEYEKDNLFFRDKAFNFVLEHFTDIYKKNKIGIRICEAFLIKNLRLDTFLKIIDFLCGDDFTKFTPHRYKLGNEEILYRMAKELFEENTNNLRTSVLSFVQDNYETIQKQNLMIKLPQSFLIGFNAYLFGIVNQKEKISLAQETTLIYSKLLGDESRPTADKSWLDDDKLSVGSQNSDRTVEDYKKKKRRETVQDDSLQANSELKKAKLSPFFAGSTTGTFPLFNGKSS